MALPRPLAHPHPAARHGCNRVGQSPAPAVVQRAGWAEHDLPRQLCLCRIGHEAQRTQIDAKLLIETAHPLQRAVQPYRLPITGAAQFSDQPLRLSKRIGAHQDTAIRIGLARSDQLADLLLDRGMTEYGESRTERKSTRLNSRHQCAYRMPSPA